MKYDPIYQTILDCSTSAQVFDYLMANLVASTKDWSYFVNWDSAQNKVTPLAADLEMLNSLVDQSDVEGVFKALLQQQPTIVRAIPILLASRDRNFTILTSSIGAKFEHATFSFEPKAALTPEDVEKIIQFARETRLLEMFESGKIKNVPDYVFGIEVGLNSNARKNRSGTQMQTIVEGLLSGICTKNSFGLMAQTTPKKLKNEWHKEIKVDKANRHFDFAVNCDDTLYLFETNYYGGGGSKLKATAGEYIQLHTFLASQNYKLIWITDGFGWKSARNNLEEAFNQIDHVLNLKMVTSGILQHILENRL